MSVHRATVRQLENRASQKALGQPELAMVAKSIGLPQIKSPQPTSLINTKPTGGFGILSKHHNHNMTLTGFNPNEK